MDYPIERFLRDVRVHQVWCGLRLLISFSPDYGNYSAATAAVSVALLTVVRASSVSLQILEGTNEIMRVIVSRELLKD